MPQKKFKSLFACFILLVCLTIGGKSGADTKNKLIKPKPKFHLLKNSDYKIVPVPVIELRPDEGKSYGLMPVMILSNKGENAIKTILAVIGQYNSVSKIGGGALAYFYPKPNQEISFYTLISQRFFREVTAEFFDPKFLDRFFLDASFTYLKTPFGRFFGLGPQTTEGDQSNFTSRNFYADLEFGFYLHDHVRANAITRFHTTDILTRSMPEFADTLTRYVAVPNVVDSTNFIHGLSFVFDNRPEREYSKEGSFAELGYEFSAKKLGSDHNFHNVRFEAIHIVPTLKDRLTTVMRFEFQRVFGNNVPFYEMSSMGGPDDFRSYTPFRFVDKGKVAFQIEERIRIFTMTVLKKSFDGYVDPFFEVGRVFNETSNLGFKYWKPVGGLGLRMFVPPNVIGRLDMAYGSDGFEIYTRLGYPF